MITSDAIWSLCSACDLFKIKSMSYVKYLRWKIKTKVIQLWNSGFYFNFISNWQFDWNDSCDATITMFHQFEATYRNIDSNDRKSEPYDMIVTKACGQNSRSPNRISWYHLKMTCSRFFRQNYLFQNQSDVSTIWMWSSSGPINNNKYNNAFKVNSRFCLNFFSQNFFKSTHFFD